MTFNNTGIAPLSLLDELRVEDWEEMIDINIKGLLYGIAAAGHRVVPALSVCSGTKFAVRAISVEMKAQILDSIGHRDPAGCDCPRYCVRHRAAGRCRCERDTDSSDGSELTPPL